MAVHPEETLEDTLARLREEEEPISTAALQLLRQQQENLSTAVLHGPSRRTGLRRFRDSQQANEQQQSILTLRWLRTLSPSRTLAVQQRSVLACAVQCVVVSVFGQTNATILKQYLMSLPRLTVLDLRRCFISNPFLSAVGDLHCSSLRRLYLPQRSCASQWTLEHFVNLEELDVSGCKTFTNVDFCAATLRVLYANGCAGLLHDGLENATNLEVVHVADCTAVTSVSPFAHCLVELDASDSGISSAALSKCHRLHVLHAGYHQPCDVRLLKESKHHIDRLLSHQPTRAESTWKVGHERKRDCRGTTTKES